MIVSIGIEAVPKFEGMCMLAHNQPPGSAYLARRYTHFPVYV